MQIKPGKTYVGPENSEWNMTVLIFDGQDVICLPNRPNSSDEPALAIEYKYEPLSQMPTIERISLNQFTNWATRCIGE
jgi:hypothetical protein